MNWLLYKKTLFVLFLILTLPLIIVSQEDNSQYADVLVESFYSGTNSNFTEFYGGSLSNFPVAIRPDIILEANENYFLSLPPASYVVLGFTDNEIIDYPNQNDIFIKENGCNNEKAEVWVSTNGKDFTFFGIVDDCDNNSLDLASINYTQPVRFIKIVGLDLKGASPGFDVVNVRGLPNSNISFDIKDEIDSISIYLKEFSKINSDLDTVEFIIPEVFFKNNTSELLPDSKLLLNKLSAFLVTNKKLKIKIIENANNKKENENLIKKQVEAVREYFISKGVKKSKIIYKGNENKGAARHN